jgi:hypothetical protein
MKAPRNFCTPNSSSVHIMKNNSALMKCDVLLLAHPAMLHFKRKCAKIHGALKKRSLNIRVRTHMCAFILSRAAWLVSSVYQREQSTVKGIITHTDVPAATLHSALFRDDRITH